MIPWCDEGALVALVVFLASVLYVANELRHVAFMHSPYRWAIGIDEKAACFPYAEVVSGDDRTSCKSSMADCAAIRDAIAKDPDYEFIGSCRVVSSMLSDRDAFWRDVYIALVLGAALVLLAIRAAVDRYRRSR